MNIKINFKKQVFNKSNENLILFVDENFNISSLKKNISNFDYSYISDLLKIRDPKKKIITFDINSKRKIILVSLKKNVTNSEVENLGADCYKIIKELKKTNFFINSDTATKKSKNFVGHFLHGIKLKSYLFEKYKSKKTNKDIVLNIFGKNIPTINDQTKFNAIEEGTFYARDLVSEPGNVLHPDEYAKRINSLKKFGLKINIYDEKKLKKLGMNTLLGVGQGSIRGSYLVTMEWNGLKNKSRPLAFVGKGVCFDTGGISLKPAKFMEDMTYDMAGSAVVVGLMKNLALR